MAIFPRPASPRSAAGDLWSYLIARRPHKWPLLGVSMALTGLIIWAFIVDANTNTMPRQNKIIYFQSWDSNRSDAQVILQQKIDLAERELALRKKQKEMQKVADMFGIDWRQDAARNDARRAEALKYWNDQLDKKLAAAKAEEKAGGVAGTAKAGSAASPSAVTDAASPAAPSPAAAVAVAAAGSAADRR